MDVEEFNINELFEEYEKIKREIEARGYVLCSCLEWFKGDYWKEDTCPKCLKRIMKGGLKE